MKINFFLPKKKKIVVLGITPIYLDYLKYQAHYIKPLKNEINLYFFIIALIRKISSPNNLKFYEYYILSYIEYLDPKFLLSSTDYNLFFLNLKKFFPDKKLVFFQCHFRNRLMLKDYINIKQKFKIDYFFCWGRLFINNYYKKFIDSNFIVSGSIKNNFIKINNKSNKKDLIFISQYRLNKDKKKEFFYFYKKLINSALSFCKSNRIKLKILGSKQICEHARKEIDFYNKIINPIYKKNFLYIHNKGNLFSYKYLSNYKYVLTSTSSLGYEAASKGMRVAFIFRYIYKYEKPWLFNKTGKIWTNKIDNKNISKVLRNIYRIKKNEILDIKKRYITPLVSYDPQNKNYIKKNLKNILND